MIFILFLFFFLLTFCGVFIKLRIFLALYARVYNNVKLERFRIFMISIEIFKLVAKKGNGFFLLTANKNV